MSEAATPAIPGDRSLLIVEDDKSFLQRLARAMEGRGFSVTTAESVAIDVFSPKNQDLDPASVLAVLRASAILSDGGEDEASTFTRQDGTRGRVDRQAELAEEEPLTAQTPLVVQVSRWDALKDPIGVIRGFAQNVLNRKLRLRRPVGPQSASAARPIILKMRNE